MEIAAESGLGTTLLGNLMVANRRRTTLDAGPYGRPGSERIAARPGSRAHPARIGPTHRGAESDARGRCASGTTARIGRRATGAGDTPGTQPTRTFDRGVTRKD